LGLDQGQEREGHDRDSINLPGKQPDLLTQVCKAVSSPIALVILAGGSVDLTAARDSDCVGSIIWAGYPGQSGGVAIAEVLYGAYNPAGRLTQTIYNADFVNEVSLFDMGMRPNTSTGNPGRTHRFYTGKPVYAFGTGLSFSHFEYHGLTADVAPVSAAGLRAVMEPAHNDLRAKLDAVASVTMNLCNSGPMAGAHTILPFMIPPNSGLNGNPIRQLAQNFQKVFLEVGECKELRVDISPRDLFFANGDGVMDTVVGAWRVSIGQPEELSWDLTVSE